jgi:integrase
LGKLTNGALTRLLKNPGRHSDGNGLYFRVLDYDKAYFVYRYRLHGKEREMSLGPYPELDLAGARKKHARLRSQVVVEKVDVLAEKRHGPSTVPTFGAMADQYIADQMKTWRNAKHLSQWKHGFEVHAAALRDVPVSEITTAMVRDVLNPIWATIPETASRLRARIAAVWDAAQALEHIDEDKRNPASKAKLQKLLGDPKKLGKRRHGQIVPRGNHARVPWKEMPEFMRKVQAAGGTAARALEMVILTAARSGEVLGMTYDEIDFNEAVWTVPASRMKAGREHVVPLSDAALRLIEAQRAALPSGWDEKTKAKAYVFRAPPPRQEKPLSGMAMAMLMRRLGYGAYTVHGTGRASFRTWVSANGIAARDVAEHALAHKVGDQTEQAYDDSDRLELRRPLMTTWAAFLAGNVVSLAEARQGKRA